MLHITNGDSVVATFRQARFPGKYLSWADVWLGGTHLTGKPAWRWDGEARHMVTAGKSA